MRSAVKRRTMLLTIIALAVTLFAGGSAYAFSDLHGTEGKDSILELKKRGLLQGNGKNKFFPNLKMNAAGAVTLIVNGFNLKIDRQDGKPEPKASDYFTHVQDRAWYARAFVAAHLNGLSVPKDIKPTATVTREQFVKWLDEAIATTGERAWIQIYQQFADEDQVSKGYMDSIQRMLVAKIATLDSQKRFRPQKPVTRAEAAVMVERALRFVEQTPPIEPLPEEPKPDVLQDVRLTAEKVNDQILKVTVSATAPHPGYGIEVSGIEFGNGVAVIRYRVLLPNPDQMYPQVITTVKAETYVPASYRPVLGDQTRVVPLPSPAWPPKAD